MGPLPPSTTQPAAAPPATASNAPLPRFWRNTPGIAVAYCTAFAGAAAAAGSLPPPLLLLLLLLLAPSADGWEAARAGAAGALAGAAAGSASWGTSGESAAAAGAASAGGGFCGETGRGESRGLAALRGRLRLACPAGSLAPGHHQTRAPPASAPPARPARAHGPAFADPAPALRGGLRLVASLTLEREGGDQRNAELTSTSSSSSANMSKSELIWPEARDPVLARAQHVAPGSGNVPPSGRAPARLNLPRFAWRRERGGRRAAVVLRFGACLKGVSRAALLADSG